MSQIIMKEEEEETKLLVVKVGVKCLRESLPRPSSSAASLQSIRPAAVSKLSDE